MMRLIQFLDENNQRWVGFVSEADTVVKVSARYASVYRLVLTAARSGGDLASLVTTNLSGETVDYGQLIAEQRLLPPLDHPDPAHCLVSGTGLTHLGSAQARDEMHHQVEAEKAAGAPVTDSMRLFQQGVAGGKPAKGEISVQPEWFYKGNGQCVTAPERPLMRPAFALDGGEEAELVGLYVIGDDGQVLRAGFALGNEFSDHLLERQNYLYLAHSKLRPCSFGPELLVGELPAAVAGRVRIRRGSEVVWERPFLTGEAHMSYRIESLEHHHFKYEMFRRPGDVHCHFMGTGTLSFAEGVMGQSGDLFEIEAPEFGRPLRNPVQFGGKIESPVIVQPM